MIVAAARASPCPERDRDEDCIWGGALEQPGDDGGHVAPDPGEAVVFHGVDRGSGARFEPHRRTDRAELRRPLAAQPAGPEVRLRLPAALAPGAPDRTPPQAADATHDIVCELGTEEAVTHEALGREEQLLECVSERGTHWGALSDR